MNFSEKLKTARSAIGLSQAKLAKLIGVPRRTYQDWEYGKFEPATYVQESILQKLEELKK